MQPFTYVSALDEQAAIGLGADAETAFIAGGTDLLQLMKEGQRAPRRLININTLPGLAMLEVGPAGLRIGALARMSDIAAHPEVARGYPVIAEALLNSANPQLRHMASIGGNLLQRTRCPYFRDIGFAACNKRTPGSGCAALEGENRMHAILGGSGACVATHASDLAVALIALDAVVRTRGPAGERAIALDDFYRLPGNEPDIETTLAPGDLIVAVEVPAGRHTTRSHYLKVRDRASFEFALVSAAVALDMDGGVIRDARVAMGGVGTKPWRMPAVEAALRGARPHRRAFEAAAEHAVEGARALQHNGFKIELAKRTLVRALETVGGRP